MKHWDARHSRSPGAVAVVLAALACLAVAVPAAATPVVLTEAPAYNWYHGCGPTAAGSIVGYWDLHGYTNLFTAADADVYLTSFVRDQISSPAYNAKYDPTPDNTTLPVPEATSIADWFQTSMDPQQYGWSYLSYADDAFAGYAGYRGYDFMAWNEIYGGGLTWASLTGEIDAGRPIMFLVDSTGDGGTDHFVPVFGYEDRGAGGLWYGCYTTWSEAETIEWFQFAPMSDSYSWGVGFATFVVPGALEVPAPGALLLGLAGVAFVAVKRRMRS